VTPPVLFNRFMTLARLTRGDRIIWQHRGDECTPEAVWWDQPPQMGRPVLWLSTVKLFQRRALIIKTDLRPATANIRRDWTHASLYVATPAATDAWLAMDTPAGVPKGAR
jgi:hypothetical protein